MSCTINANCLKFAQNAPAERRKESMILLVLCVQQLYAETKVIST